MSGAVVTMLRFICVTSVTYVSVTPQEGVFTLAAGAAVSRTLPPSPLGMWWRTARGETYAHEAVEQLLPLCQELWSQGIQRDSLLGDCFVIHGYQNYPS